MKKRKIFIALMICLTLIVSSYKPIFIKADSGFDASYDSGDFSSDRDGGSSSFGAFSASNGIEAFIVFSSILIIAIIVIIKLKRTEKQMEEIIAKSKLYETEICSKLQDFDIEEFNQIVFNNYKKIQEAWMNFDLESIRNLISDEMYNMYSMQLETLKSKGQKNIMENIEYINNKILDVQIENEMNIITTKLIVTCNDYIVNDKNKVIRGNKNKKMQYTYKLTFIKTNRKLINYCSNCGAKITNLGDKCDYCDAIIVNNSDEWIMTKKQMIDQIQL